MVGVPEASDFDSGLVGHKRRLMGHRRGEGSPRTADFHAQRTASPRGGRAGLVLKTGAPTLGQGRAPAPECCPRGPARRKSQQSPVVPVAPRDGIRGSHGL